MSKNYKPRIAIIGNMNNNGFSLLRYFRDLGADAYLLTFSTDGNGNLSHFKPEADTWDIEHWKAFIRPLEIPNTSKGILRCLLSRLWFNKLKKNLLLNYDVFIGSGAAPAMFAAMNLKLDIFYPYGAGIEFYGDLEFKHKTKSSHIQRLINGLIIKLQAKGIRNSTYCLNAEMSITKKSFEELDKSFINLPIPMVYNGIESAQVVLGSQVNNAIKRIKESELSIFCCSRLLWHEKTLLSDAGENWRSFSKNNDWLFIGLSKFIYENAKAQPLLVCVEYGPDVEVTKELINTLGISDYVIWLNPLQRKEIITLIDVCDVGVGEFYTDPGVIWGGTGWEVLSRGKPFLQSFNFSKKSFESKFNYPPPFILDVKSGEDVAHHLNALYKNIDKCDAISKEVSNWFERYNGIGLAKQWLNLLQMRD